MATFDTTVPQAPPWVARPRRKVPTDGFRFAQAVLFVFTAAAVDVFNVLDRGGSKRYAILVIPIGVVALIRLRHPSPIVHRPRATDKALFVIWVMGMVGSLYGVFLKGGNTTARPLFFPMTLGFLYLFVLEPPTDDESGRLLRYITYVGAVYVGLAALINIGVVPHLAAYKQFRNAQFAYVMIGIGGAIIMRRRGLLAALLALEAVNFAAYPSATSVLCTLAMLITFFMTKPYGSRARPYVVAIVAAAIVFVGLMNISRVSTVTGDYFSAVGKTNANYGRLAIWTDGIHQWQQSPFVGQVFTGGTVAQTIRARNGQPLQLPFHNDYVLFLAEGGLVGLIVLISFIVGIDFILVRRYRDFVEQGRLDRAKLLRLLLVGFNSFFFTASFNPVMEGLSRSMVIFSMYGLAMLVCSPDREAAGVEDPAGRPEPAAPSP